MKKNGTILELPIISPPEVIAEIFNTETGEHIASETTIEATTEHLRTGRTIAIAVNKTQNQSIKQLQKLFNTEQVKAEKTRNITPKTVTR